MPSLAENHGHVLQGQGLGLLLLFGYPQPLTAHSHTHSKCLINAHFTRLPLERTNGSVSFVSQIVGSYCVLRIVQTLAIWQGTNQAKVPALVGLTFW